MNPESPSNYPGGHPGSESFLAEQQIGAIEILESMTDGFFALAQDFRVLYVNHEGEKLLLGRGRETLIGKVLWDEYPSLCGSLLEQKYRCTMVERVSQFFEFHFEEMKFWYEIKTCPSPSGGMVSYVRDITERKLTEQSLAEKTVMLQRLADANILGIATAGVDGVHWANDMFLRIAGFTRADLEAGKVDWQRITPPEYLPLDYEGVEQIRSRGICLPFEKEYLRDDGTRIPILVGAAMLKPEPLEWVAFTLDLTARKQAEAALRASEEFNRRILESSRDCITVLDSEGKVQFVNAAGQFSSGVDGAALDTTWLECLKDEERELASRAIQAASSGRIGEFECHGPAVTGQNKWWDVKVSPIVGAEGKPEKLLAISRDITRRKSAEDGLRSAYRALQQELARAEEAEEKLLRSNQDLAEYARVISHDLQEPLRTVLYFARSLRRYHAAELSEAAKERLEWVVSGAGRLQRMVKDLLYYSRIEEGIFDERVIMEAAVDQAIHDLHTSIEESGARVTVEPLAAVTGNHGLLTELMQNLIGNAIKYAREGHAPSIHISCREVAGQWEFSVADNGVGIDANDQERIFGVFKRLHGPEIPGTGIGLALCRKIVERHGGRIWVESQPGSGTTLRFTLPSGR